MNVIKMIFKLSHPKTSTIHIILICFLAYFSNQKEAKAQVIDSIHYGWTVYEYDADNETDEGKRCYISSFAKKTVTSHTAKRHPYILITRYAKTRTEEVSIYSGYEYRVNSTAHMLIDNEQFKLFVDGDTAWLRDDYQDKNAIQKMLQTNIVRIRSDSAIGTYAIDEYWMRGLARAYSRMKELCQ